MKKNLLNPIAFTAENGGNCVAFWRWHVRGGHASSITIRRDVRHRAGGSAYEYNVYDHLHHLGTVPDSGCRVNRKPLTSLRYAVRLARARAARVLELPWWVTAENIRRPRPKRPKDGVWSFADLQRKRKPDPEDLVSTLRDYAETGAAISGDVVVQIIGRANLDPGHRASARLAARRGIEVHEKMREPREASQYRKVLEALPYAA